ncbi:uracil-DNA glycosylase [Arenibacter sp. GZD96]|uniref:uracil-DNA glycosylase n=1 Tax=Aurantibrevibacter litoralis TaxID=3106030 RepID=UPI002AFFC724|nr:uracil-DNA glycosylase [Arenibacter sp. GZD-96]MEA1785404.1 uracil-DNA glycosylase [Arenibacter sp. GZD-96]
MKIHLHNSWEPYLGDELKQPYFLALSSFLKKEYSTYPCYPNEDAIFAAFNHCTFENTKVVIIGQDPYHGINQAHGLCFSVPETVPHPPSLINIFKELQTDLGKPYPISGNLTHWATQGVLLLNATLTVRAQEAGSHQHKGWEIFTDKVITTLSQEKEGLVFLLWGGFAKKKSILIDSTKHRVLTSGHPSPLSANRGFWFGNGHFSKTNAILRQKGIKEIQW